MKILIAEDEVLHAEMLTGMLESWGHAVTVVESGQAGAGGGRMPRSDLILLDVFFPDISAVELIPQIKSIQPDARIITLTGQSSRELERRLRELGISYFMAKPFQRGELQAILCTCPAAPRPSRPRAKPVTILPG